MAKQMCFSVYKFGFHVLAEKEGRILPSLDPAIYSLASVLVVNKMMSDH